MNPVILYRTAALLLVALCGYGVFALWFWRPGELLVTAGLLVVTVPLVVVLRGEARRARRSPFGPVNKWGPRP